jgi:hypothetical protein
MSAPPAPSDGAFFAYFSSQHPPAATIRALDKPRRVL